MWTMQEMKTWNSDILKQWYTELDDSYPQLTPQGKWEAGAMMTFVREIIYSREDRSNEKV